MKKINYELKYLTAIGSLLVISGHFGSMLLSLGILFPYDTFHMAMFVFVSGYFVKKSASDSIQNVWKYILRKAKHHLLPYFVWNILYGFVAYAMNAIFSTQIGIRDGSLLFRLFVEPFQQGYGFGWNSAAWFLPALFLSEAIDCMVRWGLKCLRINSNISVSVVFLVAAIWAIVTSSQGMYQDSAWKPVLLRTPYLLFWYSMGTLYKSHLEKFDKAFSPVYTTCICLSISLLLLTKVGYYIPIVWSGTFYAGPVYVLLRTGIGIWFWLTIARVLFKMFGENKYIVYLADHSSSLMMHQAIVGFFMNIVIARCFKTYAFISIPVNLLTEQWTTVLQRPLRIVYVMIIPCVICVFCRVFEVLFEKLRNKINNRMIMTYQRKER